MPEGIEIEIYRQAAEQVVGRTVASVHAPDDWYLKDDLVAEELSAALVGQRVEAVRGRGKLMIMDFASGARVGVRFGMTGRLVVDGVAAIRHLEYSSRRNDPAWIRWGLRFADGSELMLHDPRRLGAVSLGPNEEALGVDMFTISLEQLRQRVFVGKVALKARLLDQQRIAGVGNLIADEVLWRAGIDPARPASSLDPGEEELVADTLHVTVRELLRQGGSHTGLLHDSRERGGFCPRDGEVLDRRTIGGRTTFSCPAHQF